jgi:broad specificity phosphatase PhoE
MEGAVEFPDEMASRALLEETMRLVLVRHGQSVGNVEQRIQGADDPLTDLGRQQAEAAGRRLADRADITHLYASNLDRAFETASIIGRHLGLEPQAVPGLAEIDAGVAAGLLWSDWADQNPAIAARILDAASRSPYETWEGGESGQDMADRVLAALDVIVTQHLGTDDVVVVVSHGGPLAWIAAKYYGDPLDVWPSGRGGMHNTAISEIAFDAEGQHEILSWNDAAHTEGLTP